jgi:pilus assembly protein Flp/PilA
MNAPEAGTQIRQRPIKEKTPMLKNLVKLWKDEEGATAVEYGLIVAAIAGVIIVVVSILGGKVNNTLNKVQNAMP